MMMLFIFLAILWAKEALGASLENLTSYIILFFLENTNQFHNKMNF